MRNCREWMGWNRDVEVIQKFSEKDLRAVILNETATAADVETLLHRAAVMRGNLKTMYGRGELSTIPFLRLIHLLDRSKDIRMEEFYHDI